MKKGVIIVLSLLVVGLGGYIVYDKCLNKTENTKTEVKKDNVVSLYVDDPIVQELSRRFELGTSTFKVGEDFGYFFKNDETLVSDIPNSYKALIAIMSMYDDENYVKSTDNNLTYGEIVKASDVENRVQEIFGNVSFKNETTPAYGCDGFSKFTYNETDGSYSSIGECGGGPYEISETNSIVKAEIVNDNILNIYVKPLFVKNTYTFNDGIQNFYPKNIYSDFNMTNLVATFNNEYEENHKSYTNKLDTYKFSFEKDGSNYYFKSVEKVK